MRLLWQRLAASRRLLIASHCRSSFLPFRVCPSLGEAPRFTKFVSSLIYSQQHAVMGVLLDQSLEPGKRLPPSIQLVLRHAQLSVSIKLHFRDLKGQLINTVEANDGDDILSIAHEHDIDLEGSASILCDQFVLPTCTHDRCLRRFRRLLHLSCYSLSGTL